ncbi:MAG: T9SS type A sorting domain-containing protein, partial [Candidatus Stygibacter australis]|nr:T9SS type A sorting domain-containing protein [Candidatus Stygibacter australis]
KIINVVLNVTNGDDNNSSELPEAVTLNGNYPNPFNPETEIMFLLPNNEKINLSVYNLKGQLVRTLVDNYLPGGSHSIIWDGKTNNGEMVSSGVYFYKLSVGETSETRKMILLK